MSTMLYQKPMCTSAKVIRASRVRYSKYGCENDLFVLWRCCFKIKLFQDFSCMVWGESSKRVLLANLHQGFPKIFRFIFNENMLQVI